MGKDVVCIGTSERATRVGGVVGRGGMVRFKVRVRFEVRVRFKLRFN